MIFAERYLSERFKAGVEQGREEGRQEGREEGREEALKWLAQVEEAKRQGVDPLAPPWEQNGKMS